MIGIAVGYRCQAIKIEPYTLDTFSPRNFVSGLISRLCVKTEKFLDLDQTFQTDDPGWWNLGLVERVKTWRASPRGLLHIHFRGREGTSRESAERQMIFKGTREKAERMFQELISGNKEVLRLLKIAGWR